MAPAVGVDDTGVDGTGVDGTGVDVELPPPRRHDRGERVVDPDHRGPGSIEETVGSMLDRRIGSCCTSASRSTGWMVAIPLFRRPIRDRTASTMTSSLMIADENGGSAGRQGTAAGRGVPLPASGRRAGPVVGSGAR